MYEQPQSQGIEVTQSAPSAARRHGRLETQEPKNWNGVWEWDRVNVQVVLKKAGNFMKVGEGSSWYSASRSTRALVSGPGSILAGRVDWNGGNQYSGTPLIQTPMGQNKVSILRSTLLLGERNVSSLLERCPHFSGVLREGFHGREYIYIMKLTRLW